MACFGARGTRKRGTWQHQNRDTATELPLLPFDGAASSSLLIAETLMLQPINQEQVYVGKVVLHKLPRVSNIWPLKEILHCWLIATTKWLGTVGQFFFHFTLCKTFICRYFVPGTIARAASVVHWSVGFSSLLLSPAGYTCWHSSVPCWPTGRRTVYMQLEQKKRIKKCWEVLQLYFL